MKINKFNILLKFINNKVNAIPTIINIINLNRMKKLIAAKINQQKTL